MLSGVPFHVEAHRAATIECVIESAIRRDVPANVVLAIGQHEAGKNGSAIKNTNGSFDLGNAGVNTVQLDELARYGIDRKTAMFYLMYDGCYNYDVAAYLLARHLHNCTQTFWACVGNYRSKTEKYNLEYQKKIIPLAQKWNIYLSKYYKTKEYRK